jgi:hypothetical protein
MSVSSVGRVICVAIPLGAVLGCDAGSGPASTPKRSAPVDAAELPALGDYLPPLDNDRIEVAPPEGWYVPPRSSAYVLRVQKDMKSNYPSIIITAEDYDAADIVDVSGDNVRRFGDRVAAALKKERSAVRTVEVGGFVGVGYGKRGKVSTPVTTILELACLETVVAGRKYRIELRSEEGSLEEDEPYLLALAGGIRFLQAESHDESKEPADAQTKGKPKTQPEEPQAEKPAEEEAKPEVKEEPAGPPKKDDGLKLDLDKLDKILNEE